MFINCWWATFCLFRSSSCSAWARFYWIFSNSFIVLHIVPTNVNSFVPCCNHRLREHKKSNEMMHSESEKWHFSWWSGLKNWCILFSLVKMKIALKPFCEIDKISKSWNEVDENFHFDRREQNTSIFMSVSSFIWIFSIFVFMGSERKMNRILIFQPSLARIGFIHRHWRRECIWNVLLNVNDRIGMLSERN